MRQEEKANDKLIGLSGGKTCFAFLCMQCFDLQYVKAFFF